MSHLNYLYVEDDRLSRQVMEMLMGHLLGITTYVIFEDSTDFISRVEALDPQPDVFLLDIHMKPISGFEMLKMLRAHPRYQERPVYALTASVMNEEVTQLREAGFNGVLGKPLDADLFPEVISKIEAGQAVWQV